MRRHSETFDVACQTNYETGYHSKTLSELSPYFARSVSLDGISVFDNFNL